MEEIVLDDDIKIFCTTAKSFPEGVLEAHQNLHKLVEFSTKRKYYGISYPDKTGKIIYKAALNELVEGELKEYQLETYIIKKGKYISITIKNFMQDIPSIGNAFEKLIHQDDIDPKGACIERYINDKDVQCMVRMKH